MSLNCHPTSRLSLVTSSYGSVLLQASQVDGASSIIEEKGSAARDQNEVGKEVISIEMYDAIIVGSSHNALVTAAYLTRLGGVCWCWRRMIDQAVSSAPWNAHCRVSTTMSTQVPIRSLCSHRPTPNWVQNCRIGLHRRSALVAGHLDCKFLLQALDIYRHSRHH